MSWTDALRAIIRNCYKHHCREDLLPIMDDSPRSTPAPFVMQTINNPDGSLSIIQIDTSGSQLGDASEIITLGDGTQAAVVRTVSKQCRVDDNNFNVHLNALTLVTCICVH